MDATVQHRGVTNSVATEEVERTLDDQITHYLSERVMDAEKVVNIGAVIAVLAFVSAVMVWGIPL